MHEGPYVSLHHVPSHGGCHEAQSAEMSISLFWTYRDWVLICNQTLPGLLRSLTLQVKAPPLIWRRITSIGLSGIHCDVKRAQSADAFWLIH